jgi:hypothetical protein
MERETGFEPATSSLGSGSSIVNKGHSVFLAAFYLPRIKQFSFVFLCRSRMLCKRCSAPNALGSSMRYTGANMATPGVYVYKRNGRVAYIGRSDSDVEARESASFRAARYDLTVAIHPRTSALQAYRTECRLYHKHNPIDNSIHPRRPSGSNWRCPVQGCEHS